MKQILFTIIAISLLWSSAHAATPCGKELKVSLKPSETYPAVQDPALKTAKDMNLGMTPFEVLDLLSQETLVLTKDKSVKNENGGYKEIYCLYESANFGVAINDSPQLIQENSFDIYISVGRSSATATTTNNLYYYISGTIFKKNLLTSESEAATSGMFAFHAGEIIGCGGLGTSHGGVLISRPCLGTGFQDVKSPYAWLVGKVQFQGKTVLVNDHQAE